MENKINLQKTLGSLPNPNDWYRRYGYKPYVLRVYEPKVLVKKLNKGEMPKITNDDYVEFKFVIERVSWSNCEWCLVL